MVTSAERHDDGTYGYVLLPDKTRGVGGTAVSGIYPVTASNEVLWETNDRSTAFV